jgi:hypothetical protein
MELALYKSAASSDLNVHETERLSLATPKTEPSRKRPSRGFLLSFVLDLNNIAIRWTENRIHGSYTRCGGCEKPGREPKNLTKFLPNSG